MFMTIKLKTYNSLILMIHSKESQQLSVYGFLFLLPVDHVI